MTLETVTCADFSVCVGESFDLAHSGATVRAELSSVTPLNQPSSTCSRRSFSLLFHVPTSFGFRQGICQLSHPRLGALELFLVALGPDAKGMRLEAVFNFL
jgi:hypothetical protein